MPSQVFFMDLRASAKEPNFKKFGRLLEALDLKNIIKRKKKRPLIGVKLHFGEKGNTSFIRPIYAVVIYTVAHFGRTRMDCGIGVVAIRAVGHVAGRDTARLGGGGCVTESVSVGIGVEGSLHAFVDIAVAVVIDAVAGFGRTRMDGGIGVVAIRAVGHVVGGLRSIFL